MRFFVIISYHVYGSVLVKENGTQPNNVQEYNESIIKMTRDDYFNNDG